MKEFAGVYAALPTPYTAEGTIDHSLIKQHIALLDSSALDGYVVCGTVGEGLLLSINERMAILETVKKQTQKKVVACTSAYSIQDAITLSHHAADRGADALLLSCPTYYPAQEGTVDYFDVILKQSRIPVILYNFPSYTQTTITRTMLEKLSHYPALAGIKDSSGSFDLFEDCRKTFPELAFLWGGDSTFDEALARGCDGTVSAIASSFPGIMTSMYGSRYGSRYGSGDSKGKTLYTKETAAFLQSVKKFPSPQRYKALVALRLPTFRTSVRAPLVNCTDDEMNSFAMEYAAEIEALKTREPTLS